MNSHPHVYWARLLLDNILKGNGYTLYKHSNGPVIWGNPKWMSITDCSGFVNALLEKSYHLPIGWTGLKRPYASTYYEMINEQINFIKINDLKNVSIGDFIAIRFPPHTSMSDDTGHIMMINDLPKKISNHPFIPNTQQWSINIIDQSSAHGSNDTRYANKSTGLGSGNFRIYTNESGNFQGYCWSTDSGSKYIDQNIHPFVIGRLIL